MAPRRSSRRDFLLGRAAADAASDAVDDLLDEFLPDASTNEVSLGDPLASERVVVLARRAMACEFELRLNSTRQRNDTEAGMAALDLIEQIETRLTVYRPTSELIEVNRLAAKVAAPVDPSLFDLLELCGRLHDQTDGAFDPTSGPLSRVWGFFQRDGAVPEEADRQAALERVGWRYVTLDPEGPSVRFAHTGIELNANSIGKGYALDRAGERLGEWGVADSLMHGGRSTLLARGDNQTLDGGGWRAGLRDPLRPDRRLAELTLRDEAMSTSGSGTQFFEHGGRRYGHLIDPRTGWPADGLFSATVLAPTGAEADALSTACYILGPEGTARLCRRRPELRALLVAPGEAPDEPVRVHAFNMDGADWRPVVTGGP